MIGIYKITNLINNKCYIGQSNDIEHRFAYHKNAYNWNRESTKPLYLAFKKYGVENFKFEVIEECSLDKLNEREVYYISLYESYENGYNSTIGGGSLKGEFHPKHELTENDVIDIRTRYANLERKHIVYEDYKDRIGRSGFHKIWNGESWRHVKMEVYTDEAKDYHSHDTANKGAENGMALVTESDVIEIRKRKLNGETIKQVYENYKDILTFGSFSNIWFGYNWKHIVV